MLRATVAAILMWIVVCSSRTNAQDASGRWVGRWNTYATNGTGHQGTLRVNLRPNGDGTYQGTFAGRFFVVLPYVYRAKVVEIGDTLYSTKRLGPLGDYQMQLHHRGTEMHGGWSAGKETGGVWLRRR